MPDTAVRSPGWPSECPITDSQMNAACNRWLCSSSSRWDQPHFPNASSRVWCQSSSNRGGLRGTVGGDRDALISRNTGGMSFDFSERDSRIYLAGVYTGILHQ